MLIYLKSFDFNSSPRNKSVGIFSRKKMSTLGQFCNFGATSYCFKTEASILERRVGLEYGSLTKDY